MSRLKLYERYDVELPTVASNSNKFRGWFGYRDRDEEARRQQLPIEEWKNIEIFKYVIKNASLKSKIIAILVLLILSACFRVLVFRKNAMINNNDLNKVKNGPVMTKYGLRPATMDPDSHARTNPFAPEGHTSYMEGVLEIKRKGGERDENKIKISPPPPHSPMQNPQHQQSQQQGATASQAQVGIPPKARKEPPKRGKKRQPNGM
jgi:hypothetical protein